MVHRRFGKLHPLCQFAELQLGVCAAPPSHLAQRRRQCVKLPCRFQPFDRRRLPQAGSDRLADVGGLSHLADHGRPRLVRGDKFEVVPRGRRVHRTAAEEQAAKHRLAIACGVGDGSRRRLHESRRQTGGQGELDEKRHSFLRSHRLVLGLHVAHGAAESDHLARDGVAEQREIGRPSALNWNQAATRAEIDAQQLTQLAAGPGRQKPGHLVLDIGRERNANYLPGLVPGNPDTFLTLFPPKVQSTEPVTARAPGTDLQPHTLLALDHTMVMARAIERRLWVLRRLEKMDFPVRVASDWHEGINFAGAHSLPLICLVEDLASAVPYAEHDNASPAARAEGYGLAAETIDRMRRGLMAAGVLDEGVDEQVGRECATTVAAAVDNVWSRDKEGG